MACLRSSSRCFKICEREFCLPVPIECVLTWFKRVFDLWHGTILRHDHALQLLLIIDCICDWARDTYCMDILRCLSDGKIDPRAFTPASSIANSQSEQRPGSAIGSSDSGSNASTSRYTTSPALDPSIIPGDEEISLELDSVMLDVDNSQEEEKAQSRPSTIAKNDHKLLRYDKRHSNAPAWTKSATIQH